MCGKFSFPLFLFLRALSLFDKLPNREQLIDVHYLVNYKLVLTASLLDV